ncbi:Rossmann-fold NAD(P)-binding domain-containing protein [Massilia sp. GCM10023247]|uniref:nucleoside-diphosphate sugar epimerase n=1 Tax=Massilia sp. GCM10023247 TaxID=3252643 RepID=UPI0036220E53
MPAPPSASLAGRRVLLAGASGLVGGELLRGLLADDTVAIVHVLARRPLALTHPKLHVQAVDFAALPPLPALDEAYLALGTTIKVAGSQAAFRAVDFDAGLAVARAAFDAGARRLGLVSAMGADAQARVFYNRVKGELEEAVKGLGFEALVIARPSLLLGDRGALGQPARTGEHMGSLLAGVLRPLIPARYRPIEARDVARALLAEVPRARGVLVLPSDAMQG